MCSGVMGSQLRHALSSGIHFQCKGLLLGLIKQESGRIMFLHCRGSGRGPVRHSSELCRVVEENSEKIDRLWMHLELKQVGHVKSDMECNVENEPWSFVR